MHETPDRLHETPKGDLRLRFAGAYEAPAHEPQPLHRHSCWELVYYRTGHVDCQVDGRLYRCEPGLLMVVPPMAVHGEDASPTGWSCYCLGIEAPACLPWSRRCRDDGDGTYAHLCRALIREWTGQTDQRDVMIDHLLAQVAILLQRAQQFPMSRGERIVREVEHLFLERLSESLTIQEIAREVGLSPSLLRYHFAHERGQSPLGRLHALRIEQALALIRTSDLTLQAIASLCGYDSASHLSRQVKRTTGQSPGTFRSRT